jgi:ornithine cyclodeaminase
MERCVELVAEALAGLARGAGRNPLRRGLLLDDGRILGSMPGYLSEPPALGVKIVTVTPANHGGEWDAHQGVVCLFDEETGVPSAILDASEVTAIRTAAASGVATRALAREDAGDLAILGSGVQARTHLEAMLAVRDVRRVRVWSPTPARREAFARREAERHGLEVEPVETGEACVHGADLVCTTTAAKEPCLAGAWLTPGCHVNAAGACTPKARELDAAAVARARVIVDSFESAANEAGDLLLAEAEGAIGPDHVAGELGAVLLGEVPGRTGLDEVTLFESLGIAVEDVVVARDLLERARAEGVGVEVALGGRA